MLNVIYAPCVSVDGPQVTDGVYLCRGSKAQNTVELKARSVRLWLMTGRLRSSSFTGLIAPSYSPHIWYLQSQPCSNVVYICMHTVRITGVHAEIELVSPPKKLNVLPKVGVGFACRPIMGRECAAIVRIPLYVHR